MFREALRAKKKSKAIDSDALIELHEAFIAEYGWIPIEEFRQLQVITVMGLMRAMNQRKKIEAKQPIVVLIGGLLKKLPRITHGKE